MVPLVRARPSPNPLPLKRHGHCIPPQLFPCIRNVPGPTVKPNHVQARKRTGGSIGHAWAELRSFFPGVQMGHPQRRLYAAAARPVAPFASRVGQPAESRADDWKWPGRVAAEHLAWRAPKRQRHGRAPTSAATNLVSQMVRIPQTPVAVR